MAQVKYSEALIRRAIRHQVRKALGPLYWIAVAVLAGAGAMTMLSGRHVWLACIIGSFLLQACLLPLIVIRLRSNTSIARLLALGTEDVAIDMTSGRFRANSAFGSVDLPLRRITSVTCSPDYWLLQSGRSTMMLLPTLGVPWPIIDGWLNELRRAGAKVE